MRDLADTAQDIDINWRDLSFDIGWEASPAGIIRCRTVLNRRSDIFNAVEGMALRTVHCEAWGRNAHDLLADRGCLRHIEVRLQKFLSTEHLYLSARLGPNGWVTGTICGVDPKTDDVLENKLSLLSRAFEFRNREDSYRREADLMLTGLRILLSQRPISAKIELLVGLAAEAINGESPTIVEFGRDGTPRLKTGEMCPEGLSKIATNQVSPVAIYRAGSEQYDALCALIKTDASQLAFIFLPVNAEGVAIVCAPQDGVQFHAQHVDFAHRFALILKQALVLKEEQDMVVQSARLSALGQMSASLAHELRQPLNTISVATQNLQLLAQDGILSPDVVASKVARILSQVDRASQIMDRVRRFSRKNTEQFADIDLLQLAKGVALLMDHPLGASGVTLTITIPDGLKAYCDNVQIEQVLANLVGNAIDALTGVGSAQKADCGHVTIGGCFTESGVVLRVEDDGPGFPLSLLERSLETFYTTKSAEAGTGLGLSICHMIAREHAGHLQLGNSPSGAYVEIHLPRRSAC